MSRAKDLRNITATGTASEDDHVLTYDDATKKVSLEPAAGGDVVDDTSPELGGDLYANGKRIVFHETNYQNLEAIAFTGSNSAVNRTYLSRHNILHDFYIANHEGSIRLVNHEADKDIQLSTDDGTGSTATYLLCDGSSGEVKLYHYGAQRLATKSGGVEISGSKPFTLDGSSGRIESTSGELVVASTTDNLTLSGINVNIASSSSGEVDITSDGLIDLNANNGNVDITSIGGTVTLAGDTGNMTFTNTGTGSFIFGGTSTGGVGIGNTSPASKLHVSGTQGMPNSNLAGMLLIRADGSTHGMTMGVNSQAPWGSFIQAQDQTSNTTNYPLSLQPAGGIVGVGTDAPNTTDSGYNSGALHVHAPAGSGSQIRLTNTATGTGNSSGFMISKWSDQHTYITNFDDGKDVRFTISNSSGTLDSRVLCLKADATYGKVGIGTDSPEVVLEVNGDQAYDATDNTVVFGGRSGGGNGNNRRFNLAAYSSGGTYGGGIKIQTRDSANLFYNRMTIDHNGYVGIGTESPQRMLHIADGDATGLHITNDQSGHGASQGFSQYIRDDNQDIEFVQRGNKRLVFYTNNTGVMAMKHDTNTGTYPYVSIGHDLSKADKMLHLFGVNPAVMVEGNSTGYTEGCFIQKCDDSYRGGGIYMYNGNGGSQDNEWFAGRVYASSADWRVCFKAGPSGVGQDTAQATYNKFRIYQNGNYYFSGSNVSDERIKQDIVAETDQLTNVLALKPKTFKFKPEEDIEGNVLEGAEPSSTRHGLIAQDVLDVLPHLVTGDTSNEEERLGVDYPALTSVLVKAMQEQQELIQSLTARITALES